MFHFWSLLHPINRELGMACKTHSKRGAPSSSLLFFCNFNHLLLISCYLLFVLKFHHLNHIFHFQHLLNHCFIASLLSKVRYFKLLIIIFTFLASLKLSFRYNLSFLVFYFLFFTFKYFTMLSYNSLQLNSVMNS